MVSDRGLKWRFMSLMLGLLFCSLVHAQRAARPDWTERDTGDVFFEDAFREGLQGNRPDQPVTPVTSTNETEHAWSKCVTATTLENEIKEALADLKRTSKRGPLSGPAAMQLRHRLQHLAATLAVVAQYDGEVRWQAVAGHQAQELARLATETPTASTREEAEAVLQALVAGTAAADRVSVEVDTLATRPAIMTRLQEAEARLKAALANARGFKRRRGMIEREAEIIALQAAILTLPELDDSADDDYVAWCQELSQAAEAIAAAATAADLDAAQQHFGTMQQSCTDCHEMYRG